MIKTAIIGGLITLLTPVVFPIIFQNFILFEKLGKTKKEHKINFIIFIILTIISITFLFPIIFADTELINDLANDKRIDYWIIFPLFVLIIWISFSFVKRLQFLTEGKYLIGLRCFAITYFVFRLFIGSLSGIGPIMGLLLSNEEKMHVASFGYSIGITLPFLALMSIVSNKYEIISSKKWWVAIQVITLGYLLVSLISKLITINLN